MVSPLLRHLDAFAGKRVAVVGDVMLDEFVDGEVLRISPEAPVPIVEVRARSYRAGGAANVAGNVVSLGGRATLLGVVGIDSAADGLVERMRAVGVTTEGVIADSQRPTTVKTRIVAQQQQIVRIDSESRAPLALDVAAELAARLAAALADADACVVSDYAKGVVSDALMRAAVQVATARGIPLVVDPKRRDFTLYRGATVVTPNLHEVEVAAGMPCIGLEDLLVAGMRVLGGLPGSALLVTRGAAGMTLLRDGMLPFHLAATARAVFDVTGAGDTVVSALGLALAGGAVLEDAMAIANRAAGIAVSKSGTVMVSREELVQAL